MKYAIFITGSAGAGKSTLTQTLKIHFQIMHRRVVIFNLDPACEFTPYEADVDIREIVTSQEVQEFVHLGPNGALIYAFQHFFQNERSFLSENTDFEDDFLIFDCPGQIELYIEHDELQRFANQLTRKGYECCCLYLMDSTKLHSEESVLTNLLISNCIQLNMNLPFVTVATKCDMVNLDVLKQLLEMNYSGQNEFYSAVLELQQNAGNANIRLVSMDDEERIGELQFEIDQAIHYGE